MATSEVAAAESLLKRLEGRWVTIYTEVDGEAGPETAFSNTVMEHSGNKFKIEKAGTVAYEGTFFINESVKPVGIVLLYSKSINPAYLGGPRAGIIQLIGNTKKTNFSPIGFHAPTDFTTFPGSNSVLTAQRREGFKPKPEDIQRFSISNFGCNPW